MARVLIVEDYRPLAGAIRMAIVREGHVAEQCHSVREALASQDNWDCAVLDVDLPDGNGVALAEQLLAEGRVGSILFFTASRDTVVLERAVRLGVVIDKSGGCDLLMAELGQMIEPEPCQRAVVAVAGGGGGTTIDSSSRSGMRRRVRQ